MIYAHYNRFLLIIPLKHSLRRQYIFNQDEISVGAALGHIFDIEFVMHKHSSTAGIPHKGNACGVQGYGGGVAVQTKVEGLEVVPSLE